MGCPSCGAENRPDRRFCGECGAALPAACPSCGFANEADEKFCGGCGQRMAPPPVGQSPSAAPPPAKSLPQTYTPKHLAEKILASRAALEGERKQVTVLFADVVGSTELIQGRDAEEAQSLLDGVVRVMMDAVHRFEGTVSRLMGDGLMALFGAPIAHEDHAVRACYAALAMQEAVRRHAERVRRETGAVLTIRVGLSAGEVVVRTIRDDLHMDFTAMGQTVHLASRMEQLATPGSAVLTPETLALVEGYVHVRSLGSLPVKGLAQPIEAFELLGAGSARTRLQAASARGLTRFVGRQAELETLHGALEQARTGRGQVAALVGEPGVGKSRLFYEFAHSHRTRDWLVLEGGSVAYGKATSYMPVIDLLKDYCRIEARDDERAIREKVAGRLLALDPALVAILAPLLSLLDLTVEDDGWATLDPPQRRQETLDALRRLLLRASQEQPLLLVCEDLHWIDAETQALLDSLVEALPTARIVLLVNYRPEYTHAWGNKSYYTQLRIDPLGGAGAGELLDSLLGTEPAIRPLKSLLIARTEGNPFFLEESVRDLVETDALIGERGAYRLTRPIEDVRVPATVQAVLAARIDRLAPEEKRLLQTAAVIGKDVSYSLIRAIADTADAELQAVLSRLQAAELLYPVILFPEVELTFKHALTHDVAYGSLLQDRRKALHARIVAAIEGLDRDRLDQHVERLAHHALRGELWEQAIAYCRQAGSRAMARSAVQEAVGHLEQALSALEHAPTTAESVALAIDVRFDLRTALWSILEYERANEYVRQAETLAEAAGDRRRLGWVSAYRSHYYRNVVDHQQAVEAGEQAIAIAAELGDLSLLVTATDTAAGSYHEMARFARAMELLRANLAALHGALAHDRHGQIVAPSVSSRTLLGYCLAWQGEFAEATLHAEEAVRIADAFGHPQTVQFACVSAGLPYIIRGDAPRSVALLERALAIGRDIGQRAPAPNLLAFAGQAYTLAGRVGEAVLMLERSLETAAARRHRACTSIWTCWMAGAYLRAGRHSDAEQTAVRAIELARNHRERGFEGYALHQLGDVVATGEAPASARAEQTYQQALVIARELGLRPLQAHCHLGLGKLYRRTGRPDEARAELATAVAMLREMGMAFWLPEAEGELADAGR